MMSVLVFFSAVPYLVPTGIAAYRDHPEKTAIFLINLFLGWTIIGWIVALVWSCTGRPTLYHVATLGDEAGPDGLKLQGRDPRIDSYGNPKL